MNSRRWGFHLLTWKTDRYKLRRHIQFETRVSAAHYSDIDNIWKITTANGSSKTCRYFVAASGCLSVPKNPSFPGLKSYAGEWYLAATWPAHKVEFQGKRIAIVGTGSTGIHLIPKLAPVAKEMTVFQRTPNYVLPGRNFAIDEYQAVDIKANHEATWEIARNNLAGHAFKAPGRTVKEVADPEKIRQIFDYGWERGCFNFQLETFDDCFTDPESNEQMSEYVRQKIRAIVQDPVTAEILCPKYPFGSKRPPSGHNYYETFNRANVKLVDISRDEIDIYEKGIRTSSGAEHEFDMIIFALGFDTGTGAMEKIDIKGSQDTLLRDYWAEKLRTFAGILVHGFPNMFIICGAHMPAGNMPVFAEIAGAWTGKAIRHMEKNKLATINVTETTQDAWTDHVNELWDSIFLAEHAKAKRSWFVGTNIPGKPARIMFYFGGPKFWSSWLEKETNAGWAGMNFSPPVVADKVDQGISSQDTSVNGLSITAEMLESVVLPLQSDEVDMSHAEKFNLISAASARYIDWAVKEVQERGLAVKQDYRVHWWKVMQDFVKSDTGKTIIQHSPSTREELEQLTSKLGIEGEAIARVGPEIARLLTGKTHPLAHILKGDLLFRMYLSDEGARPNRYVGEYAKMLSSQKKDLKILEIGAGTGGTTLQVLQACSPDGEPFCATYMYTDISASFFKSGRTTLKKWQHLLTFQILDVENDPVEQGFEEHAYDLVIAANVVHATRSLTTSLRNIHKLLKPGTTLSLVELTRLTPYFNMAFGPLPGWWAGIGEGRTESPLQSPEQWNEHLRKAGFSGVDVAAYDLPEPERHSALLLSTTLAADSMVNGR